MGVAGIVIFALLPFIKKKHDAPPAPVTKITDAKLSGEMFDVCKVNVPEKDWQYIIVHHSGTKEGNAANFDAYHKNKKKWRHGLAYHFVIGNGNGSADGEIETGPRWEKQIHGAHSGRMDFNRISIGVCLVGNFEKQGSGPTQGQMESLQHLLKYLCKRYNIALDKVIGHNQVQKSQTACPGKNFPFNKMKFALAEALKGELRESESQQEHNETDGSPRI